MDGSMRSDQQGLEWSRLGRMDSQWPVKWDEPSGSRMFHPKQCRGSGVRRAAESWFEKWKFRESCVCAREKREWRRATSLHLSCCGVLRKVRIRLPSTLTSPLVRRWLCSLCNQSLHELSNPGCPGSVFYLTNGNSWRLFCSRLTDKVPSPHLPPNYFGPFSLEWPEAAANLPTLISVVVGSNFEVIEGQCKDQPVTVVLTYGLRWWNRCQLTDYYFEYCATSIANDAELIRILCNVCFDANDQFRIEEAQPIVATIFMNVSHRVQWNTPNQNSVGKLAQALLARHEQVAKSVFSDNTEHESLGDYLTEITAFIKHNSISEHWTKKYNYRA